MKKLAGILFALFAFVVPAGAQSVGKLNPGNVWGNPTGTETYGTSASLTTMFDAFCSTQGSILMRGASFWNCLAPSATVGLPLVSNGTGSSLTYTLLGSAGGGTGNAFFAVAGPASTVKTFTFPNSSVTMAALSVAQSWSATQTFATAGIGIATGTSLALGGATIGTNALAVTGTTLLSGALTYGGVTLANTVTGTGSMVLGTSPTLTTPHIASIVNTGTLTLPTVTDTLVGRTTTDTLTNKTYSSGVLSGTFTGTPTFSGANFIANSNLAQAGAATLKGNPTASTANVTDFTIQGLTARGAPDAANDKMPIYDNAAGTIKYVTPAQVASSSTAGVASIAGNTGAFTLSGGIQNEVNAIKVEQMNPGGRVTFAASTPVMNVSQASQTHIYYAPYTGKYVPVYTSGVGMRMLTFTSSDTDTVGLTITLGSNWAANSNYDVYAYNNAGVAGLCTSVDWSAGTTPGSNAVGNSFRGVGAGSAEQQIFKGFYTNKNSMTCRTTNAATITCAVNECTYLATARTDGTAGQVSWIKGAQGNAAFLNLWNQFNQVNVCSTQSDSTVSWTYNSPTQVIRQENASAVNQINFLRGQASGDVDVSLAQAVRPGAVAAATAVMGVALNSTTVFDKESFVQTPVTGTNMTITVTITNSYYSTLGANFVSANENTDGSNTQTMFGAAFMAFRACQWM